MKITLLLPASSIPDGTIVRKPSGEKPYTITRSVKIYGEKDRKEVYPDPGIMFLVADNSINCIPDSRRVAIDFVNEQSAIDFLQLLMEIDK